MEHHLVALITCGAIDGYMKYAPLVIILNEFLKKFTSPRLLFYN